MSAPIRILHVLGGLNRGGAETLVMNIYRKIDKNQFQFDFVVHNTTHDVYEDEILQMGGRIFRCPKYSGFNHNVYKKWWNKFFCEHEEYKIIHGHVRSTASIYLKIARKFGRFAIAHSHSTKAGKGFAGFVKSIFQSRIRYNADFFMGCSKEANRWLFGKKVANDQKRCLILKNGIDVEKFKFNTVVRERVRNELGIKDDLVIGTVGRIDTPKNPLFLVDIFYELHLKNKKIKLLWVGDGPLKKNVVEYAKDKGIIKDILFVGSVPNVYDYLDAMDAFIFPSLWEGLGMSLIEAQANGITCFISSAIPQEAILCKNVYVVENLESSQAWADAITNNSLQRNVENNLVIKKSGFDIDGVVKVLTDVYNSAM